MNGYGYPKRRKIKWPTETYRPDPKQEGLGVWKSKTPIKKSTDGMSRKELMNRVALMR